jgi:hypothetical protein
VTINRTTSACTGAPGSPAQPDGVTATPLSRTSIALAWNDVATDETNYYIERSPNGINTWTQIADLPADTEAYTDSALNCSTQYFYQLRTYNSVAALYSNYVKVSATTLACAVPPTAVPPPTTTPVPTAVVVSTPTLTPTPDLGGEPDIAEDNDSAAMAFRVSPGNRVSLNFNSGQYGQDDIDFFVMNVKNGVTYTCETSNLGLGTDTIMSIYGPGYAPDQVIATHDDIDAQSGNVASRITWDVAYDGQVYIVVDQVGALTYPGAASYDLECYTGEARVPSSSGAGGGGGGGSGSSSSAISVEIIGAPERVTPPELQPSGTQMISIVIAYDENANNLVDLSEGVLGMSVRAIAVTTNTQLAHGFTDERGSLQLIVTAPQGTQVMVVVPFLSIGRTFLVSENSIESWSVLLPSSLLPGVIP